MSSPYERSYILPQDFTPRVKHKDPFITKVSLKETLEKGVYTVVYTRLDGSEDRMNVTLLTEYIPKQDSALFLVEQTNKREDGDILSVWDVDQKGWRSLRTNTVTSVV